LRARGCTAAAIVMLGGVGAGTAILSPQLQHSAFDPCGNQTRLLKYYEREAA